MALPRVGGLVPAGARSELRAPHFPFLGSRTESFQFRWSLTVGHTRSHSEHGSQATCRRWYLAFGPGRVGRRRIHGPLRIRAGALLVLKRKDDVPCRPGKPSRSVLVWVFLFPKNFIELRLFFRKEFQPNFEKNVGG